MNDAYKVDADKLNQALQGKLGPCPLCHELNTYVLTPTVMELREFHGGDFIIGGMPIVPLVALTCKNCGNTVLINALVTGIVEQPNASQQRKEGGGEK